MGAYSEPSGPLEPRFRMPDGWRWHDFERNGRRLRFGGVMPASGPPDAIVVGLQGVNEFCEKYFEIAHDMLDRNLGFWMMDWHGQGKSGRYLPDPQKRHSDGFDNDLADLRGFIDNYVVPAAVKTDAGRLPLVMLAHSMGAHLGLRYLHLYPDAFACAMLTAPLTGILPLKDMPLWLQPILGRIVRVLAGLSYARGGGPWKPLAQRPDQILSSDPVRGYIADRWAQADPDFRIGGVTYGWVYHAVLSCLTIREAGFAQGIRHPMVTLLAGIEHLVDNGVTRPLIAAMPRARLIELPDAKHEIMMERDEIRAILLKAFDDLLKTADIKNKIKPF